MPARKTSNKKATHCKLCGIEYNEAFVGKKCHPCQLQFLKDYHAANKERHNELAREKRRMQKLLEPPKEKKSRKKFSDEELKKRNDDRTNAYNKRKSIKNYINKNPEIFLRKPLTKNKDREWYVDNETFETPLFYLDFSNIKDCPKEFLSCEYWDTMTTKLSSEMLEYIAARMYEKDLDDKQRWNCSYTVKDVPYGIDEKGKIRFYPT